MSSWHFNQLRYALGIGGLFSFYGIVSLIVWFAGEKLKYPVTDRVVIIVLVLLTLPIALLIGYINSRRKNKSTVNEGSDNPPQVAMQSAKDSKTLSSEFESGIEEVSQFLRSAGLDVYSLPWYLVMGSHKSGKTALVLGSSLNFQALPSQRQSELKFIRPTRSIEWKVTSEAVFIDTAGRYQSDNQADAQEWRSFLDLLKKYRPERPIDGVIVAASLEKLMVSDEKDIEEQAKILRSRIDDVTSKVGVKFPVYVVFTHSDAIEGFRDSFSASQKEGQKLIWGATLPLERNHEGVHLFDSEFDTLLNAVMKRRLFRLSAPFPPIRQLRIFNFPLHFASTKRKVGHFINILFRPNPFSENPLFRGFYFTAVPVNRPKLSPGDKTISITLHTVGETYFTERLFRDVILKDGNLVRTFLAQRQKPSVIGWILMVVGSFIVFTFLILSVYSLYRNKLLIDSAVERAEKVIDVYRSDAGRDLFAKNQEEITAEINAIENLRKQLAELDEYERNGAPWWMRFGLYSGNRLYRDRLLNIYFNAVEQRFKKPMIRKLEADLQAFASSQLNIAGNLTPEQEDVLGKNYDLLKAYLMLSGKYKEHVESSFLATTLADYWKKESKVGTGLELVAQQQLEFWAKQIDRDDFPFILTNENLIADVRRKLQAYPAWQRYYKRKVTDISKQLNNSQGDITVANILARNGASSDFLEGSYRVPNAYTIDGYYMMDEAIKNAAQELGADDWVMGEKGKTSTEGVEASLIQERYLRDYTDEWRRFVKGISIRKYDNQSDAEKAFEEFISANSPIKVLMKEIARQTNLSAGYRSSGLLDWILSWFKAQKRVDTSANTPVEKDFRPLFSFAEDESMAKYSNILKTLRDRFAGMPPEEFSQVAKDLSQDKDVKLKLRDSENTIANLLAAFNDTPSGQELASVLKRPVANLRDLLGAGVASQIKKAWNDQLLPKAKEIEKGYPFEDSGDADLTKLSIYLNPVDGDLTKFYKERLEKFFEEVDGKLKVKEGSEVKFSDEFVDYLNRAFKLREALFAKSKTPSFSYEVKLQKVDGAIVELVIDGQKIDSSGTGSTNFKFPATSGETGVILNVSPIGSVAGTINQTYSANTSPSNVYASGISQETSSSKRFPGTWGLLKFFEAGSPRKNQSTGEYMLSYRIGNKTVNISLKPTGGDLFDRNLFRSVRAPQNILR